MPAGADRSAIREFTVSHEDLVQAHRAVLRRRFGWPRAWLWLLFVAAAVYGAGLARHQDFAGTLIQAACFLVGFPAAVLLFGIPWQVRPALRTDRRFGGLWMIEIAPDALRVSNPGGETRYLWSGLADCLETSDVLLPMTGPDSFIPLPLRALRPGDREAILRRLVDAGMDGRAGAGA